MSRTISSSSTIGIPLIPADNPVTITPGATIGVPGGVALLGVAPTVWTIANQGHLTAGGTNGMGVQLQAGGTIVNGTTVDHSPVIYGALYGVDIEGGAGFVTNEGSIGSGGQIPAGAGVQLLAGGTVTNGSAARITGGQSGAIYINGGTALVTNQGTILGLSNPTTGVALWSGGTIINGTAGNAAAVIAAPHNGIGATGAPVSVTNAGTILGTGASGFDAYGIYLGGGGNVTNLAGGKISGSQFGIAMKGAGGEVQNAGTILASFGKTGVSLTGGSVQNSAGGLIEGGAVGVRVGGSFGTVVNDGSIGCLLSSYALTSRWGVTFDNAGMLLNGPTGVIAVHAIVHYYGRFPAGHAIGNASTITNFGRISSDFGIGLAGGTGVVFNDGTIDATTGVVLGLNGSAGTMVVVNSGSIGGPTGIQLPDGGATVTNTGTIAGTGGTAVAGGNGNDLVAISPAAVFAGAVAGGGGANTISLLAGGSGTLAGIGGNVTGFGTIAIAPGATWHLIGNASGLASGQTITGLDAGDTISLDGVTENLISAAGGTLHLGGDITADVIIASPYASPTFSLVHTPAGTDISVACFAEGTPILTDGGPVTVERLRPGDRVVSAFGGTSPVVWTGHRRVRPHRHARPDAVNPVLIRAGAIGPGVPSQDLFLSPDHALLLDGLLVPAGCLVNHGSIVQLPVREVTYWHVELPQHDALLAAGTPCESYLDIGNRGDFEGGAASLALHPMFASAREAWAALACAPQCRHGAPLERIRARLAARAAGMAPLARPAW